MELTTRVCIKNNNNILYSDYINSLYYIFYIKNILIRHTQKYQKLIYSSVLSMLIVKLKTKLNVQRTKRLRVNIIESAMDSTQSRSSQNVRIGRKVEDTVEWDGNWKEEWSTLISTVRIEVCKQHETTSSCMRIQTTTKR